MGIVIGAVVVAAIIFAAIRFFSAPRQPIVYGQPQQGPFVQTIAEPMYVEPMVNPIAEIATVAAAEVIGDVVENAIFDGGGGGYDPGFDPGFGSSGGSDSF